MVRIPVSLPEVRDQACEPVWDCDLPVHGRFALQMWFPHKAGAGRLLSQASHTHPALLGTTLSLTQLLQQPLQYFNPGLLGMSGQSSQ